jgi:hypothetical protein
MPRFRVNRWWTLILTLSLGCAFIASSTTRATAESLLFDELGGTDRGDGTLAPPLPGVGDPDSPMSGRSARREIAGRPTANVSTSRAAGDGTAVDSVMMWHLRAVLQSLRLWGFVRL